MRRPQVITDNRTLHARYNQLRAGDLVVGRVRLAPTEEHLLLDLVERGVLLFPSGVSQLTSRSKNLQARIFGELMVPGTASIHNLHQLQHTFQDYHRQGVTRVVTKQERRNAGLGIHLWSSIEEVFTMASLGTLPLPFVLQPYVEACRDIRVIRLGEYTEAYWRDNPANFRNNLHFGGQSTPCILSGEQETLCRQAMERGKFPYAHLDLMVTASGETFLAEINLRGGIRGARITPQTYQRLVTDLEQEWLRRQGHSSGGETPGEES